jgi:cellobiose phosphorylase
MKAFFRLNIDPAGSTLEEPLREELFSSDQLERFAKDLAGKHALSKKPSKDHLLRRLEENETLLQEVRKLLNDSIKRKYAVTPAGEWLIDNFYLIEEHIRIAKTHFPKTYSEKLPQLSAGPAAGITRIYDLVLQIISHSDGKLDMESLNRFIKAYQTVTNLHLGELWAVPIVLRLALIENIRRVAARMAIDKVDRNLADYWAKKMIATTENDPKNLILVIADMARSEPPVVSAFVSELTRQLTGKGPGLAMSLNWIEEQLSDNGRTGAELVNAENRKQTADQVSVSNSIGSLRLLSSLDWRHFVETNSIVEQTLREDNGGVYGSMDFSTRDHYRHVVEGIARKSRSSEQEIAMIAIRLTKQPPAPHDGDQRTAHVGYYLIGPGLGQTQRMAKMRLSPAQRIRSSLGKHTFGLYLTSILLISLAITAAFLRRAHSDTQNAWLLAIIAFLLLLSASQLALAVVNFLSTLLVKPHLLPRMDFSAQIAVDCSTLVIVPSMLTSTAAIENLVEALEVHFLANRNAHLYFGLLTDFTDAASETLPEDQTLLDTARLGIAQLNKKYQIGKGGSFFLFHRPRKWNPAEGVWMGYERKRGKLSDLNALLRGDTRELFSLVIGDQSLFPQIKYVITLDADTQLPLGSAWKLIGTMAHPLNRAWIDKKKKRVTSGYGILQPRITISLPDITASPYARMHGNEPGIDPYTRASSDVYQDLFAEGSYIGKGIYDVDIFQEVLDGQFLENRILSHDLLEGCYIRAGLVSDIQLFEKYPTTYRDDINMRLRWTRGDWQISSFFLPIVPGPGGKWQKNPISGLSRWKIVDNLRQSLVPIALTVLLLLGWLSLPSSLFWTMAVSAIIVFPIFIQSLWDTIRKPKDVVLAHHLKNSAHNAGDIVVKTLFTLICLPFQAFSNTAAIARTAWRLLITHKHLLEWNPSGHNELKTRNSLSASYSFMWTETILASILLVVIVLYFPLKLAVTVPILLLWLIAPCIIWLISQPRKEQEVSLTGEQRVFLRKLARKTWSFFEQFVVAGENWLPPDNFQEQPVEQIAHRTSPTNIGLCLLANVTACNLGYLTTRQMLERTAHTVATMEKLERYRGHFYNWYDTQTLSPLFPKYISTVDSGNLAAHLLVLKQRLLAIPHQPIAGHSLFFGLRDTLGVLKDTLKTQDTGLLGQFTATLDLACASPPMDRDGIAHYEDLLSKQYAIAMPQLPGDHSGETQRWASMLAAQLQYLANDSSPLSPAEMTEAERLADRCDALADMQWDFLYNKSSHLFSIGYSVQEHLADASRYDLLASEVRLCIFTCIAQGKLPEESWFALGRLLTNVDGNPILLSWSGSMFEYLMPMLVMPTYENTLLDQSCRSAVAWQIVYGKKTNKPWGISESGYNSMNANSNYQYRAFGAPGLGLKRGLEEDSVIAPYATALALMVSPEKACKNLELLGKKGLEGRYGLYESIDYTPSRLQRGQASAIVYSFMAHHHGMSLLSMAYLLLDKPLQKLFEAEPQFRATLLLLQERIPRATTFFRHTTDIADINYAAGSAEARVINTPDTPSPEVQLLSNGRYHVMVTNAGGGYSIWNDLAVTRWQEDGTCDNRGSFCYIRDIYDGTFWSNTYQPALKKATKYELAFSQGRVDFRTTNNEIETHTEIVVSPEDDIEMRRVHITNCSAISRTLEVTSYAEVVLAPAASDLMQPAFSNLFVQTEILHPQNAILCTRRPRSSDEKLPWMFHLMTIEGKSTEEVSYETDRMAFIGRGNTLVDSEAMRRPGQLSGSQGSVLDPIVAIRYKITLEPEEAITIDMVTGIAGTKAGCQGLVDKYQDNKPHKDRVFEMAWTHSQVLLRQINASEADAQLYGRLAGSILFANSAFRADPTILISNHRGQSGLWAYSISGDLPIVLLKVEKQANMQLVQQLIQAHAYWRLKGIAVDLVIWNEEHNGYRQVFQNEIQALVPGETRDRPGGIFVRALEQISSEDRVLFQTVARIIISDSGGTLADHVNRKQLSRVVTPPIAPSRMYDPFLSSIAAPEHLTFFNGLGGFSPDGSEYVIVTDDNNRTPAPWVNVIANPSFGTVISENGTAYTWTENAHELRLTPWNNDPVSDTGGEAFYLRDEETAHFWSFSPLPARGRSRYITRHGFGYSVFEHIEDGIYSEMLVWVDDTAAVKFIQLKVRNDDTRARKLSVTGYIEWVLGSARPTTAPYIHTEIDPDSGAFFASDPYNAAFSGRVAFFDTDQLNKTFTADRTEFIGRNGSLQKPGALSRKLLSGRVGLALDPCAAIQIPFDLAPNEELEIVFRLGAAADHTAASALARQFRGNMTAHESLEKVKSFWQNTIGAVRIETPDAALDHITNGWLTYQTLSSRLWGRSGFYQSGGAFGFRDQLQDVLSLLYAAPSLARTQILLSASRQFQEGDVQHWWHPPLGSGVRTRISDDFLWLPFVTARYMQHTGDTSILDEAVHFIEGRELNPKEESYYDRPIQSAETASLYEHCIRAIRHGFRYGIHGLPLIGTGDWNDGYDKVGSLGKGESVWLAFFLYDILCQFTAIAQNHHDPIFAAECKSRARQLKENIDLNAWDGDRYIRAWFDDGTPLGSSTDEECKIDSIAQSWAVLSEAGEPARTVVAMETAYQLLVNKETGIIRLLTPPFDKSTLNPGYIKGYVPSIRENGGQYTHAAVWMIIAFARLGNNKRVWELLKMINPVNHGLTAGNIATYKVEPYVLAADVYSLAPHAGRGGWTWYTGSAGWLYRLIIESFLGLQKVGNQLTVDPCIPEEWTSFTIHYRYKTTHYHIVLTQTKSGEMYNVVLDGHALPGNVISLNDDGGEHQVDIAFPKTSVHQKINKQDLTPSL